MHIRKGARDRYTHHWIYRPGHRDHAAAGPTILADTRSIIARITQMGIIVAGPDGTGAPVLDHADGIALNGDAHHDLHGNTFGLLAPLPPLPAGTPTATGFCTTNRAPYDLAVTAVLLRCHLLLPDTFSIGSDGSWDHEWAGGAMYWSAGCRRRTEKEQAGQHLLATDWARRLPSGSVSDGQNRLTVSSTARTAAVLGQLGIQHLADRKAISRSDTESVMGVFKDGYQPHQYDQWLSEMVANMLDDTLSIGWAVLLKGGAVAWMVNWGQPDNTDRFEVDCTTADKIGALLLNENRLSINHRNGEDELEPVYTYTPVERADAHHCVLVLNAIDCYEYQSCEHDGWKTSDA